MRTWIIRRAQSSALIKGPFGKGRIATAQISRLSTRSARNAQYEESSRIEISRLARRYAVFRKLEPPQRDIASWTGLLDGALPPHLWKPDASPPATVLGAVDVAEILLAAQYPLDKQDEPLDLLFHLGVEQNRWSAVVWLIKLLVDKVPAGHGADPPLVRVGNIWQKISNLHEAGLGPIELDAEDPDLTTQSTEARSLDDLLAGQNPKTKSREDALRHNALGQVWRTLGSMTKACAGGDTRPEVLEIIAYLHHREVMPLAIYQAEPNPDNTAIQQPPLIPFLSSRILTSLSDAAWRAHEKLVIEEARANGSKYAALRPEIRGSVFRVHVAGLRPEVWMELILWSCLYGGWTKQGAEVLSSLTRDSTNPWAPVSWAEHQKSFPENYRTEPRDWRSWEYIYKTRSPTSMDESQPPSKSVSRTISSEVVNAFIDALIATINVGVGSRGVDIDEVVGILKHLDYFLTRHKQGLSFGTMHAVVLRILDTQSATPDNDSGMVQKLVSLTWGFGAGLTMRNTGHLPAYVQDGTMAMQGILHRALYGQIAMGSFEGALQVFQMIQSRADRDKFASVANFFGRYSARSYKVKKSENSLFQALGQQDMFTSNLPSIEYPSFDVQIPPTILAPFLDQVTQAGAFDFGRWLLYRDDVDGPVIRESSYNDPVMQPSLILFAAASNDQKLLAKFKDTKLSRASLGSIFDSQVQRLRWSAAVDVLKHLASTHGYAWDTGNLAVVVRTMLQQTSSFTSGNAQAKEHINSARMLVKDMVTFVYDGMEEASADRMASIQSLLSVLAAIDTKWFHFAYDLRPIRGHHEFILSTEHFNIVLQGVVAAYGSAAGRHLLGIFWPHSARRSYDAAFKMVRGAPARKKMPYARPEVLDSVKRQRIIVAPPGQADLYKFVGIGALTPNTNTILIILRKALREAESSAGNAGSVRKQIADLMKATDPNANEVDKSPRGMVVWAVRRLAELPYVEGSIIEQVDDFLLKQGMDDLRGELPEIYATMEEKVAELAAEDDGVVSEEDSDPINEMPFSTEVRPVMQTDNT